MRNSIRATIYFSPDIFKAVRLKAATTRKSISDVVNRAVTDSLAEDATDFAALALLQDEANTSFDSFVSGLRRRGTL